MGDMLYLNNNLGMLTLVNNIKYSKPVKVFFVPERKFSFLMVEVLTYYILLYSILDFHRA